MILMAKNRFLLYIAAIVSVSLACGATTEPEVFTQKPTVTETAQSVNTSSEPVTNRYEVTAETLRIRDGAGESFPLLGYLENGQVVTCSSIDPAEDGGRWCKHELGYSNVRYMKGIK